jgi:hypothetical protein
MVSDPFPQPPGICHIKKFARPSLVRVITSRLGGTSRNLQKDTGVGDRSGDSSV